MNGILRRALIGQQPHSARAVLIGLGGVIAGTALRELLEPVLDGITPYVTFFPAVLAAGLFAGGSAGCLCLAGSAVIGAYLFAPPRMSFALTPQATSGLLAFLVSGGLVLGVATLLRRALMDLEAGRARERALVAELQARVLGLEDVNGQLARQGETLARAQESLGAIFNASSEGLTLCRLIRDADGTARDYQVLDVNPSHAVLTGAARDRMLEKPVSLIAPPIDPRWIATATAVVASGRPQNFEVRSPATGRWLDIRVSPVMEDLFAQTFIDVTARRQIEAQRTHLLAEMNHRVKNNFQMVASMLDLQARRSSHPEVAQQLANAVRRVHLLGALHDNLALQEDGDAVEIETYLATVCDRLNGLIDDPSRIRLTLHATPARLDAARAVPLGFILNELVTNAIKYAFPPPVAGEISVSFTRSDALWILKVGDSGGGLPDGSAGTHRGLGMRLVNAFVHQINGTVEIEHRPGVAYTIRFPPT